jgi:hypothetical protein
LRLGGGAEAKRQKGRIQISTRSEHGRKLENRRKGAIQGSRKRVQHVEGAAVPAVEDSEWSDIED